MSYIRVIPRDLFNEAKLLKCIGRLIIVNGETTLSMMSVQHDDEPFNIVQDTADGALSITNIQFKKGQHYIRFYTAYNSKRNYPLFYAFGDEEDFVFDEEGNYSEEFKTFIKSL